MKSRFVIKTYNVIDILCKALDFYIRDRFFECELNGDNEVYVLYTELCKFRNKMKVENNGLQK